MPDHRQIRLGLEDRLRGMRFLVRSLAHDRHAPGSDMHPLPPLPSEVDRLLSGTMKAVDMFMQMGDRTVEGLRPLVRKPHWLHPPHRYFFSGSTEAAGEFADDIYDLLILTYKSNPSPLILKSRLSDALPGLVADRTEAGKPDDRATDATLLFIRLTRHHPVVSAVTEADRRVAVRHYAAAALLFGAFAGRDQPASARSRLADEALLLAGARLDAFELAAGDPHGAEIDALRRTIALILTQLGDRLPR